MTPAAIINDRLKQLLSSALTQPQIVQATRAPYLTLDAAETAEFSDTEAQALPLLDEGGLMRLPFDRFRFCVYQGPQEIVGYVERRKDHILSVIGVKGLVDVFIISRIGVNMFSSEVMVLDGDRIRRKKSLEGDSVALQAEVSKYRDEASSATAMAEKLQAEMNNDPRIKFVDDPAYLPSSGPAKANTPMEALYAADQLENRKKGDPLGHMSVAPGSKGLVQKAIKVLSAQARRLDACARKEEHLVRILTAEGEADALVKLVSRFRGESSHDPYHALLISLVYTYLVPYNFIATVTPKADGRSVEWLQAREHYTIVHRHHPANKTGIPTGAVVHAGKVLKRTAHTRRAHLRLLQSDRYTKAKGQRIFIRATWVGPKEWCDSAGQTYRIKL